jgi:drug/metabolite transporter (DMT)-like permease
MAPTARVSPMVYSQIIWSTLFGYVVFGDVPSLSTVVGGIVIIATGILLIRSRG